MLYNPSKRCLCLGGFTYDQNSVAPTQNLKMAIETATTAPHKDSEEDESKSVPYHPALTLNCATLSLTLDFALYAASFWTGEEFIPYRASLLNTLPLYYPQLTRLLITLTFPHHRTQSNTIRLTQRDLVNRIAGLTKSCERSEVEVIFRSPETDWSQVRCLAPFWGTKGHRWRVKVDGKVVMGGSDLGTKLQAEWRRMKEGRELY